MKPKLLYVCTILLVSIRFAKCKRNWSVATQGQCQFTVNDGFSISFSHSPLLFVNKEKTLDLAGCRTLCCSHDTCNGYVWEVKDLTENCKLLKCSSQGQDCKEALKQVALSTGQVGFVTGFSDGPVMTTVSTTQQHTTKVFTTVHTSASNVVNKTSTWLMQKFSDLAGENIQVNKSLIAKKNSSVRRHSVKKEMAKEKVSELNVVQTTAAATTTTTKKQKGHSDHTDTVSLVVAAFIGVSFFVAIIVMIARRWVENLRDKSNKDYRRLSHLLNGI